MTDDYHSYIDSDPSGICLLTSNAAQVEEISNDLIESCDDTPGLQAHVAIDTFGNDATINDAFKRILAEAKLGSRWGKDLTDIYRDFLESIVAEVDAGFLEDEIVAQFSKYDVDPYESEAIGDILSLGINVKDELSDLINTWGSVDFNKTDLTAAIGYSLDTAEIESRSSGTIILESTDPISEITKNRRLSFLPSLVQDLVLLNLSVILIVPEGNADEMEYIEELFRRVGRFDIHRVANPEITISDHIEEWVDEWYDSLCYDVDTGRVSRSTARKAASTAQNLENATNSDSLAGTHFINAIKSGLQVQFTDQKLGRQEDRFEELWTETITSHPNYDQYRSKRSSFPQVRIARNDGTIREFALHHKGSTLQLYLNGTPLSDEIDPVQRLIDTIEKFLEAEHVGHKEWSNLVSFAEKRIERFGRTPAANLVERALLQQGYLPPLDIEDSTSQLSHISEYGSSAYDSQWYQEHWRTILSSHRVTSQAGVTLIEKKQNLCDEISGDDEATAALYEKLQRDIDLAWDYYPEALTEEITAGIPNNILVTVDVTETESTVDIEVTANGSENSREVEETVSVRVFMPYRDVEVDGQSISKPTISKTADAVINSFEGLIDTPKSPSVEHLDELLYDLIVLYVQTRESSDTRLIYFDELIEFCLTLPGISGLFRAPKQSAASGLREALGRQSLKTKLERAGGTYHRKGSDPYTGVTVNDDRYVAVDLQVDELNN